MRFHPRLAALVLAAAAAGWAQPVRAQERPGPASAVSAPAIDPSSPFLGGVPTGEVTPGPLALSLKDAIARGLQHNLGVLLQEQGVESARGSRWQSLSGLLPDMSARVGEARRKSSLAEFGFTEFPGITSRTIGPFNVFDTRLNITQNVFDLAAIHDARAGAAGVRAANFEVRNARDLVVLVVANLYLETVAATSRVDTARAALTTARALNELADDLKRAGIAAGIDTLRAQVQVQTERERLIVAENQLAKTRLMLARAIGLPPAQDVALTDRMPDAPIPGLTLDAALALAYASRGDYLAAQAQVQAADASHRAARAGFLPTLQVTGEVGRVGTTTSSTDFVYAVAGSVVIPVFQRGRQQARLVQTGAELDRRKALAADLKARIDVEVRSALLDLNAAQQALEAATTGRDLANEQLGQSRDRFSAGVTGNIEVVQSQEAVAAANETYTSALYAFNLAKAMLARAVGQAEASAQIYLGGAKP
jgi:outer membrane protein TolC